jgi:hypothetical protein
MSRKIVSPSSTAAIPASRHGAARRTSLTRRSPAGRSTPAATAFRCIRGLTPRAGGNCCRSCGRKSTGAALSSPAARFPSCSLPRRRPPPRRLRRWFAKACAPSRIACCGPPPRRIPSAGRRSSIGQTAFTMARWTPLPRGRSTPGGRTARIVHLGRQRLRPGAVGSGGGALRPLYQRQQDLFHRPAYPMGADARRGMVGGFDIRDATCKAASLCGETPAVFAANS